MALLRKFFKFQQHFVAGPPHFQIEGRGGEYSKKDNFKAFWSNFK